MSDRRVVGAVLVLLGIVAILEGRRLHALRTQMVAGAVVGDDTFPIVVGVALFLLGAAAAFYATVPAGHVTLPHGTARLRMLSGAGVLIGYWIILPYVGYTGSTALASIALYRAMGGYRWPIAVLLGGATTGVLYILFRVWLRQPLPAGWLGI